MSAAPTHNARSEPAVITLRRRVSPRPRPPLLRRRMQVQDRRGRGGRTLRSTVVGRNQGRTKGEGDPLRGYPPNNEGDAGRKTPATISPKPNTARRTAPMALSRARSTPRANANIPAPIRTKLAIWPASSSHPGQEPAGAGCVVAIVVAQALGGAEQLLLARRPPKMGEGGQHCHNEQQVAPEDESDAHGNCD